MKRVRSARPMAGPEPFQSRRVLTYPNGVWTSDQFWGDAKKMANEILTNMVETGHSLPYAAKHGLINPDYAADSLLENVVASINAECIPAGNC